MSTGKEATASGLRASAILPCTSIETATKFFVRLGFRQPSDEEKNQWGDYLIIRHPEGSEIHLRQISEDEIGWLEPLRNPFGIYVYSREVGRLSEEFREEIIEPAKKAEEKEWGTLEFSVNGPDGCLVRVGCPLDMLKED